MSNPKGYAAILLAALLATTSCTVGRSYAPPQLPSLKPEAWRASEKGPLTPADPVKDWWNTLNDKRLSGLVEQALLHNLDVKIAIANMEEARSSAEGADLNYFPQVTAGAYANRQKQSTAGEFKYPKRIYNTFQAGFDASWEIDFFGRIAAQSDADNAHYEASQANLQDVYVTIAAEVARNYVELRGTQQRLDLAKRQVENRETYVKLAQSLESSGRTDAMDVSNAMAQRNEAQAQIPPLEAQVNALINHLSVLTGQTPDSLQAELSQVQPLPTIPSSVAVGDAGTLLKRRPDIRLAERELAASVAEYNFNVADLYPRINISGSIGFLAATMGNLFTSAASTAFAQPALYWSAFDRERVKSRIDASDARTRAQLASFDKTVLGALEEVDTGMVNFSKSQARRSQLKQAASANAHSYELARKRYDKGLDALPDLLNIETQYLAAQDRLMQSEIDSAVNVIALYKALGGGWEIAPTLPVRQAADNSMTSKE